MRKINNNIVPKVNCSSSDKLKHVGEIIRAARKYRKVSQSHLANLCGLSPKMISLVECGQRCVSWDSLQRILNCLDFSFEIHPIEMNSSDFSEFILNDILPRLREMLDIIEKAKNSDKWTKKSK